MKRFDHVLNLIIGASLTIWVMKALLDYVNYTRHLELFAANGWLWYDSVLLLGKGIIPIVAICFITKLAIRKCLI